MSRRTLHQPIPTAKKLVAQFISASLAAMAGVEVGKRTIQELGELAAEMSHWDAHVRLRSYFHSLEPYQRFHDFQFLAKLPRPRPLELQVEPFTFYAHFRAWLRKEGIDPETINLGDDTWSLEDTQRS